MNASAGLYRKPLGRLELELIETLVGTKPMKTFGRAIIGGDVQMVKAIIASQKKLPSSWYTSPFDNEGRKLVAFTVYVALRNGMTPAYEDILWMVINSSHEKSHVTACLYKKRHECVAHVVARHATETHHVNRIGNMVSNRLKNRGAAWHGMLSQRAPNGRLPGNHARSGAIGQHMGSRAKNSAKPPYNDRELQKMIDQLTESQMIAALSILK